MYQKDKLANITKQPTPSTVSVSEGLVSKYYITTNTITVNVSEGLVSEYYITTNTIHSECI